MIMRSVISDEEAEIYYALGWIDVSYPRVIGWPFENQLPALPAFERKYDAKSADEKDNVG